MPKTWFQHDMNASAKYGFSNLLAQKNGCDLYGKFWLLQEFFYSSQINNPEFKNTVRINESKMISVLKTNRRRLGTVLETFRNTLGILSETIREPFGTVYETTMPKALIFIVKRNQNIAHKEVEVDNKSKNKSKNKSNVANPDEKETKTPLEKMITCFEAMRKTIKKPISAHAIKILYMKLEKLAPGNDKNKIKILEQSIFHSWQGVFELKEEPAAVKTVDPMELHKNAIKNQLRKN